MKWETIKENISRRVYTDVKVNIIGDAGLTAVFDQEHSYGYF